MSMTVADPTPVREVVIGRNSKVWRALATRGRLADRFAIAIGHADLEGFAFTPADRVWVFAYSRDPQDNTRLLQTLARYPLREVVYVSSASTIVTRYTRCYGYPRVKQLAEREAQQLLNARILTLGIVYDSLQELPPGCSAATSLSSIEEFLLAPHWPQDAGTRMNLFELTSRPFVRRWEAALHRIYGAVQWQLRRWPCLLRPVDCVLRALGMRWYGYIHLSNRLWISMTSSSARA
ncbi:MAG TPA: hypothetical protein VIL32_16105 [Steroidobacteraceae bacterium]